MEKLLTPNDVAKQLSVSKNKAKALIESGAIRSKDIGAKKSYRVFRVRQEWLDEYIDRESPTKTKKPKKQKWAVNRY